MNVQDMPACGFFVYVHTWNIAAWTKVVRPELAHPRHDPLDGPNFGLLRRRQGAFLARVPELLSVHRSHGAERCLGNLRSSAREAWAKMGTEVHIL